MVDFHMIIGLATLAAFLLLTIVNGARAFGGAQLTWPSPPVALGHRIRTTYVGSAASMYCAQVV